VYKDLIFIGTSLSTTHSDTRGLASSLTGLIHHNTTTTADTAETSSTMDAAEDCNGPANYSLFLPDDAFNLFGEYDLNFDFNDFLVPALDEANNAFDPVPWAGHGMADPGLPDLNLPLPTVGESNNFISDPEAELHASKYTSASSNSAQSPNSEDHTPIDGSAASGILDEHQPKIIATKRKFLAAFSVTSGEEVHLHNRKRYHEERKKEVALHRMIGVCLHCKLRKVAVILSYLQ
jgi:hypothetical protein